MTKKSALISVVELIELQSKNYCVLLDASIPPIGTKPEDVVKETIPDALFFDIEKQFSDTTNTLPRNFYTPSTSTRHQ